MTLVRVSLVLMLAACTTPRTTLPVGGTVNDDAGTNETGAAPDVATRDVPEDMERDAAERDTREREEGGQTMVVDAPATTRAAPVDAADAGSQITLCDALCPAIGQSETGVCYNGECHYYCYAPLANCSAKLTEHAVCSEAAICVLGDVGNVDRNGYCAVLSKPPAMKGEARKFGLADTYGDCDGFWNANAWAFCQGGKVEVRRWTYYSDGSYQGETVKTVSCTGRDGA